MIAGDAGIGKSRLLSEFCTSLAHSRWKVGTGRVPGVREPAVRSNPRSFLNGVTNPNRSRSGRPGRNAGAIDAIAEALRSRRFTVGHFSSQKSRIFHWADAATLDVLAYIGPKLQRMRALVVASVRAEDLAPRAIRAMPGIGAGWCGVPRARQRIELGPLQGSDLQAFIDDALEGINLPERHAPRDFGCRRRQPVLHRGVA